MDEFQLPADLEHIERLLTAPPRPDLPATFRSHLLMELHLELRSDFPPRRWRFAAPIVLSVAISLGLVLWIFEPGVIAMPVAFASPSVESVATQLQQLAPGLSRADSLRLAMVRQISARGDPHTLLENAISESEKL
jgi:hypothetical protein